MAQGVVIQKAIIEIDYADALKAQLALQKAGVQFVNFGKKAKKAASEGSGFVGTVAKMGDTIDKKLEGSLGAAFRATDRFQSILGAAATAATLFTAVGAGVVAGLKALVNQTDEAERALDSMAQTFRTNVAQSAEIARLAAERAKTAFEQLQSVTGEQRTSVFSPEEVVTAARFAESIEAAVSARDAAVSGILKSERAIARAGRDYAEAQELVTRLEQVQTRSLVEQRVLEDARQKALIAQGKQTNFIIALEERRANLQRISVALDERRAAQQAFFVNANKTELGPALESSVDKAIRLSKAVKSTADAAGPLTGAFREFSLELSTGLNRAALDLALWGMTLEENSGAWDAIKTSASSALSAVADEAGAAFVEFNAALDENARAAEEWAQVIDNNLVPGIEAIGQGAAAAAFDALAYGDSFSAALNEIAQAQAKEAAIGFALESAKGLARFAVGDLAGAGAHAKAAAAYLTAGAVAGAAAAATGGFTAPDADSGVSRETFTGAADSGPPRRASGPVETTINVNLEAGQGYDRIARRRIAVEMRELMREAPPF